ncbi:hypothetical protein HZA41_03260 [Candidatus Peregrinibacteria bacterium]|nr:hypothetical protein [Candidatus Peregrinibacteria bacterium]
MNHAIAVLGPALTFTDMAADKWTELCGEKKEKIYAKSIAEVFELVEKGKAKEGIVPLENRLNGSVMETLDLLFQKNIRITGTVKIPIRHVLCANANMRSIRTIISHPQAWSQCSRFIQKHFPNVEFLAEPSTVSAMEKVWRSKDETLAAIGSEKAAQKMGLRIVANNIENDPENETEFAIIAKNSRKLPVLLR